MAAREPAPIQQLPEPPNPADRSTFNSRAYPWSEALKPWTDEVNAAGADTFYNALEAAAKASEADASATAAANSVIEADTAKTGAEAAMAGAESARDDAQSSAAAAAGSVVAANTAKVGAEAARDAAAQSAADAAQSAQDAADIVLGEFGPAIHAATAKGTPADADELAVTDSAASWELKKLTWGNLKAAVFAAFKTIATDGSAKDTLGLGTAATRDVGESSGQVMEVGAGGWLGRAGTTSYIAGYPANNNENISQVYRRDDDPHVSAFSYAASIHVAAGDTWGRIRFHYNIPQAWIQGGSASTGEGWTAELISTGNILTTTGQSTEYPMTQKAVTDALTNAGSLAPPSATYEHDALGRVDKIVTPHGDTVIGYNPDGAVGTITYPTGRVETFTYDSSGNVISMTATGG